MLLSQALGLGAGRAEVRVLLGIAIHCLTNHGSCIKLASCIGLTLFYVLQPTAL
jgi:hypothetical protein